MDLLDITFRIKKAFHIDVTNEDLGSLVRDQDIVVGDLYDLLLRKMQLRDVGRYDFRVNERLWLEIQSVLHTVTATPVDQIEFPLALDILFPRQTRRSRWDALREACPYRIRELDYPKVVRIGGFLLAAGMVLVEQFQLWQMPGLNWFWPLLGLLGIWMFGETYLKILSLCAPLRNRFPSGMKTVKDLCRTVLAANYAEICKGCRHPSNERCPAVWQQLVELLVAALGVDPDEVTFRSRLFRDLGAA